MITQIIQIIISLLLIIGGLATLVAAIGILRFPDAISKIHASGLASTFGVIAIIIAAILYFKLYFNSINSRLILAIIFILVTSPIAAHLMGRSYLNKHRK